MTANERTGWRDEALSKRHREYGSNLPAVDIDFLLIEYDHEEPKALVEYKNEHTQPINVGKSPSILAMVNLANRAGIPAFLVRYADDFSWWKVLGLNDQAASHLTDNPKYMEEADWVEILYAVRGMRMSETERNRIMALPHLPREWT